MFQKLFNPSFPHFWRKLVGAEAKQRETAIRRETVKCEATIQQLKTRVQELKKRVEKETAARLFQQIPLIEKQFRTLFETVKALENAQVSEQTAGFKIAVQEKKNFLERFNSLTNNFTFPESEENASKFVHSLNQFVKATAKNFSDNKYLYAFYRNEARAVGEAINALNAAREELEQIEKQGEKQAGECAALLQKISFLEQTRASAAKVEREKNELEHEIGRLRAEATEAGKQAEQAEKNVQRLREELAATEKTVNALKQEAYSAFAPLERPLRKIRKNVLVKRLARVTDACLTSFLKEAERELREEGSLNDLVELAALLENKLNEVNRLARDAKDETKLRESINALRGGSVEKALRKALDFEARAKLVLKEMHLFEETVARAASVKEKIAALEKRVSDAGELSTRLKKDFQALKAEVGEKASALFGEGIVLTDVF